VLNQQQIVDSITAAAKKKRIWVAYSGGVDSHVLLHLLASAGIKTYAIHINHGLNPHSDKWAAHCATVSEQLGCEFISINVLVDNIDELGMEAAAREARYNALQARLSGEDLLLTAQHQDDQAETFLLQLMRGAGTKGLSAMAPHFNLSDVTVYRPLLTQSQSDIVAYAHHHELKWVEDPSNSDTRWNRNYLRHNIWPQLVKRWPSAAKTISRSAEHCAEASELLDDLALADMQSMSLSQNSETVSIPELLALSSARRNNVLRYFIRLKDYSAPSAINLQRIVDEVCLAQSDSQPLVSWANIEVRRFQNQLYIMPALLGTADDTSKVMVFNSLEPVQVDPLRSLIWESRVGLGLPEAVITSGLTVKFRQGGERIRPQGSMHHKQLKHLFQEWAVPTWLRPHVPLLFREDELIAVVGYCISHEVCVDGDSQGFFPAIKRHD